MKRIITILFVFVMLISCTCTSIHAQISSKIAQNLQNVMDERDPDDLISVVVWLYSEAKPLEETPSWPNKKEATAEHNAVLAAEKQAFYETLSDDVEYETEYESRITPMLFLTTKVKCVVRIAASDSVASIEYRRLMQPEGDSLKEKFAFWLDFSEFYPDYDENEFDNRTEYQELWQGDGWTLIFGIYPTIMEPELPPQGYGPYGIEFGGRIIQGLTTASEESTAYPYTVYDAQEDAFYCILNVSADDYAGLAEALAALNIGRPIGDADGDDTLTILDATRIQRELAKLTAVDLAADSYWIGAYNGEYRRYSDMDVDGEVTILDATAIQRRLAGLE